MSAKRRNKAALSSADIDGMLAIAAVLAGGMHDHRPATDPVRVEPLPEPRIEDAGNGWFTVFGSPMGPFDRFGREAAEGALKAVRAARERGGAR